MKSLTELRVNSIFINVLNIYINDSVAQLGERYLDRVEVAGSNPVGIILKVLIRQGFFLCLNFDESYQFVVKIEELKYILQY